MSRTCHQAYLERCLTGTVEVLKGLSGDGLNEVLEAACLIARSLQGGGKLLLCGNGGSAADAQHVAAEFVGRFSRDLKRPPLPALALTTDSSFLTACGNDFGFEEIFSRQVEALGRPGDVVLGISTSGRSTNVLRAFEAARRKGLATVALTGPGGLGEAEADVVIAVFGRETALIQNGHVVVEHMLCGLVERMLFGAAEDESSGQERE